MIPELQNKAFSVKATWQRHWKYHKESDDTCFLLCTNEACGRFHDNSWTHSCACTHTWLSNCAHAYTVHTHDYNNPSAVSNAYASRLNVSYFLEFFPPLNCSCTDHLAPAEQINPALEQSPHHVHARLSLWVWLNVQLFNRTNDAWTCSETHWYHHLRSLSCAIQLN